MTSSSRDSSAPSKWARFLGRGETDAGEVERRFRAEVKRSTRTTAMIAGIIALIGFPVWIGFDYLVEPNMAPSFALVRMISVAPIAVLLVALWTDLGRRRPELLIMLILLAVEVPIAFMIPRLESHHSAYALGMSLAIYASAFLLIWPPRYTATLIVTTLGALALALVTAPQPSDGAAVATVAFYMVTASILSFFGQVHREAVARREFNARIALETEQKRSLELVDELDRQSREDALTGLANRRAWDEALARECALSQREDSQLAILLCDVDHLKEINDRLGHAAGDAVLQAVANHLRLRCRDCDFIARLGGDEFGIIATGSDLDGAAELGEQIRELIRREAGNDIVLARVTISVGVAAWDGANDSPDRITLRADQQLYQAKAQRDSVCAEDRPAPIGSVEAPIARK